MYSTLVKQWYNSRKEHNKDRKLKRNETEEVKETDFKKPTKSKELEKQIKGDISNPNEKWPLSTNRFCI